MSRGCAQFLRIAPDSEFLTDRINRSLVPHTDQCYNQSILDRRYYVQITNVEVVPVELNLRLPYRTAYHGESKIDRVAVVFVRIETRQGEVAWGCAAFDPAITGETLERVTRACRACADRARDLNPLNLEYALGELAQLTAGTPSAQCAFDIAFHDLLGLAAGLPLYRLLGGYRERIQTSITLNVGSVQETVETARDRAQQGFRILKIKGGLDPDEDVRRVRAVHDALRRLTLRLDADQGYTVQQALDVARALEGKLEMLEQPTPADDIDALRQVVEQSPIPVLADESVVGPPSALEIATRRAADGLSVKLATCGGLRCARQIDAIARAARLATMVGCVNEPALLIAAGLAFALSSPGVRYGDLDGHFDLLDDPTVPGFVFEDGWLIATEVPGLGCTLEL
jgi:L-alanine-DL-glutamate epimerase-like enolase superfamily enzyme